VTEAMNKMTPDPEVGETPPLETLVPPSKVQVSQRQNEISADPDVQEVPPLATPVPPVSVQVLQGQVQSQNQSQAQIQALVSIQQERLARRGLDSAEGFKDVFIALVRTFLTELVLTITVPSRLLTL
jgi:hypothetical protein